MFARTKNQSFQARIGEHSLTLNSQRTLLDSALDAGIAMPFSCRVGGCGTCKCRLLRGEVRALTESSYILSDAELEAGTILACQSVPLSELEIALDAPLGAPVRHSTGRVLAQRRLTAQITELEVALDQGLPFEAGQFTELSFARWPALKRNYSFAAPPRADATVSFFIKQVAAGALSGPIANQDLLGESVHLTGPFGQMVWREGTGAVLCVAIGSGLAPILALLEDACARGQTRPLTLLFGARVKHDLYALERIEALARQWQGPFNFVPTLSREPATSGWQGARGRVTEHLGGLANADLHAYLCGAPAMVDAVEGALLADGLSAGAIRADRFTPAAAEDSQLGATRASRLAEPTPTGHAKLSREADWRDYLKFGLFHLIGLYAALAIFAGQHWVVLGLASVVAFYVIGDALSGDDLAVPNFRRPAILTGLLWLALPLVLLIVFAAVWRVSPGDPLGVGAWLTALTSYDLLAAKAQSHLGHHLATVILTGLMIGMVGTIPAHELVHRTWDRASIMIGRWLLAFSFDTVFAIEHVYGHHRYVATRADPATAPRGRNVYQHIAHSTLTGNLSAWQIETRRLSKRGFARFGWHNAVLRGVAMSVVLLLGAWAIGGWQGALMFTLCGLWAKALLEVVNYMEHYGLVREAETPVAPRHSWNTNRRISSWSLFNLTRHSHHHAQGEVPFHALRPFADAPQMIGGYLTTIIVALVPPLWMRLMAPRLAAWDRDYATPAERALAAADVADAAR